MPYQTVIQSNERGDFEDYVPKLRVANSLR